MLAVLFGEEFEIISSRRKPLEILKNAVLCYALWFAYAVDILFNQELLTILFKRVPDNVEDWEDAEADPNNLILFSVQTYAYKILLKDWVAQNPERIITYSGIVTPVEHFFQPDGRRVISITFDPVTSLIQDLYPMLHFHLGQRYATYCIGWTINRATVPSGSAMLHGLERGISSAQEIGIMSYWQMRDNLASRFYVTAQRRARSQDHLSSQLYGDESSSSANQFEALSLTHLRLSFIILMFLSLCIALGWLLNMLIKKSSTKLKPS